MRRAFIILAVALFALLFAGIAIEYTERQSLPPLAASYVKLVPQELGAPNIITGILLSYRGFDTLGEVAVLFMVAAGVGLVLGERGPRRDVAEPKARTASTEIVQTGAAILLPLISIFAAYIIMNGHLSAGGGFQGGAVIASGVMLLLLAQPEYSGSIMTFSGSLNRWRASCSFWPVSRGWCSRADFSTAGCCRSASSAPSSAQAPFPSYLYCSASRSVANSASSSTGFAAEPDRIGGSGDQPAYLEHRSGDRLHPDPDRAVGNADPPQYPADHHQASR